MDEREFEAELERRLRVIEDPSHDDPARQDLPARDLVVLAALGAVLVVLMWVWGYPA